MKRFLMILLFGFLLSCASTPTDESNLALACFFLDYSSSECNKDDDCLWDKSVNKCISRHCENTKDQLVCLNIGASCVWDPDKGCATKRSTTCGWATVEESCSKIPECVWDGASKCLSGKSIFVTCVEAKTKNACDSLRQYKNCTWNGTCHNP